MRSLQTGTHVDKEWADTARHTTDSHNGGNGALGKHITYHRIDVGRPGLMGSACNTYYDNREPIGLFDYADKTQMVFLGFQGKPAGYFIIFCVCAVSYLIGWCIMKALVPKYKPIIVD